MENKGKVREHGITLVALVITIIILLILAGVTITTLTQTGLFENAKQAKNATENAQKEENKILDNYIKQTEIYLPQEIPQLKDNIGKVLSLTENTTLQDENGNKVVVPAGFKVVADDTTNNAKTVEQGIVVEDENSNQYVWILCTTNETEIILKYKRNEWIVTANGNTRASKDELTLTDAICSNDDIANGLTTEIKNEIAEQIKKEKNSVNKYGYNGSIYTIDARKISEEALGRYFPNTPMLAAIVKVSGIMTDEAFLEDMKGSFKHKFAKKPEVIDGNMKALEIALKEVKKI